MIFFKSRKKLKQLWKYCDKKQKDLDKWSENCLLNYYQGKIIAYREIQYEINKKCSRIQKKKKRNEK